MAPQSARMARQAPQPRPAQPGSSDKRDAKPHIERPNAQFLPTASKGAI